MKKIFIFIIVIFTFLYCDLFKEQREAMFMASCELVTAPTGGTPANINDYNSQNNILQALLYNLMQNTKHLTEWDTFNEPDMAEGVYVQYGGALFLVQNGDLAIGGAPANGRVYVKTTRAGDALTFSFVNSAAGYSWNNVYCGFYHADGTQLLPYVLYKTASGYHKYTLKDSEDIYDITAKIILHNIIDIDTWDMTAGNKLVAFDDIITQLDTDSTTQELANYFFIDRVHIIHDDLTEIQPLCRGGVDNTFYIVPANHISLHRDSPGYYDNANYNDAVMNRGYIHYTAKI